MSLCPSLAQSFYLSLFLSLYHSFLDGYCSTVQGLLDWFEVDTGFPELFFFFQIDLCVLCVPVAVSLGHWQRQE